ncbi:MAG: bifunctional methylenetetrahydrofolate dehydrogenase/methenyltetrahydrofolate cyclohydrolase FolD [Fibromonadaceae bacterium]|jgi:methylenetetrahydrofolate dehydrogenase (NADP+)/methenyltetrahydrofolate cyclohydrolase|nr:bifunctional methylenetetrahydrofolate dehydrogenase/methenyltetrahydrofolate cyclohydrolase FolD [Fibromonadaceae bacterium]
MILDGKSLATQIELKLKGQVQAISQKLNGTPALATILVGDDPSSATYVRMKGNACKRVGLESIPILLPASTTTEQLLSKIKKLNETPLIRGILLQHPVPKQINERICFDAISVVKDVDGVTSLGFGLMSMGEQAYGSATPKGIITLLEHYKIPLEGKHAVVVGRSAILGKPMAAMLLNKNCTVTICHSKTQNLPHIIKQADIVVGAVGIPELIKTEWLKNGVVAIDAGYHNTPNGAVGDIQKEGLSSICSAYTPVPGGVGPMTIATLIQQTVESASCQFEIGRT